MGEGRGFLVRLHVSVPPSGFFYRKKRSESFFTFVPVYRNQIFGKSISPTFKFRSSYTLVIFFEFFGSFVYGHMVFRTGTCWSQKTLRYLFHPEGKWCLLFTAVVVSLFILFFGTRALMYLHPSVPSRSVIVRLHMFLEVALGFLSGLVYTVPRLSSERSRPLDTGFGTLSLSSVSQVHVYPDPPLCHSS